MNIYFVLIASAVSWTEGQMASHPIDPSQDLSDRFKYNVWEQLAQTANVSNFCLSNKLTPDEMLGSCIIPVCHNVGDMLDPKNKAHIDYTECAKWGPRFDKLPAQAMSMISPHVGSRNDICVNFRGCKRDCLSPPGKVVACRHLQFIHADTIYYFLKDGFLPVGHKLITIYPPMWQKV